jgi:hypothetical protein
VPQPRHRFVLHPDVCKPLSSSLCLQAMGAVRDMWHDSFAAILSPRPTSPPLRTSTDKQVARDAASCGRLPHAASCCEHTKCSNSLPHRLATQKQGIACGALVPCFCVV